MIAAVQSDVTMQVVAVLAAVGLVVASRHLPRWWADRTAGERRPARRARVVVTSLAVVAGGALVVAMAAAPAPASDDGADGDRAGAEDGRDEPDWLDGGDPVPARPAVVPDTSSSGS